MGKAAVGGALLQRDAIQQNLGAGNSQEQSRFAGAFLRRAQIIPRNSEKAGGAFVVHSIEADSLQQDIETARETSSRDEIGWDFHVRSATCRSATFRLSPGMTQRFLSTMTASIFQEY